MTNVSRTPTTSANYNNPGHPGQHAWTLNGATAANITSNNPAGLTYDLVFSGFGFSSQIPAGAQIDGISAVFLASTDQVGILDQRIVLRLGNGPDSSNKAKATVWPFSTASRSYGNTAGDTWGLVAANPGMTLAEIVRAANFSLAIQITNNAGDPEDFQRSFVTGAGVTVNWSLPATIKSMAAVGVMALNGGAQLGILADLTVADGATLAAAAAFGNRVDGVVAGSAALTGSIRVNIAAPAVTPSYRKTAFTDVGTPTIALTMSGTNEGVI